VSFALPSGLPAGAQALTVTGVQTGTTVLVPITVQAAAVASTTTLTVSAAEQTYGTKTPATFTAAVKLADGSSASGAVRFTAGDTDLGAVPVSATGDAKLLLPAVTPQQTLQVVATFVPDGGSKAVGSASAPLKFEVRTATSATGLTLAWVKSGTKFALTARATVTLSTGQPAAGTVSFNVNGTKVGAVAVTSGSATLTTTVAGGAKTVVATFVASEGSVARSTKTATATVKSAASTTTLKTVVARTVVKSGATSVTRYRLTASASVGSGGKAVAGTVAFSLGGKKIGTVTLVKGAAKVSVNVPKGAAKVVATFTPTGTAPVAGSSRTVTVAVR